MRCLRLLQLDSSHLETDNMNVIDRIYDVNSKKGAPGLERIRRLLALMGNPEKSYGIIHVAGTNGKGSTSHLLRSVLVEAGYRVGMFTSPHISTYNERFQVDYGMISDEDLERIADYVMSFKDVLAEEGYGYPSLFEILTATTYVYFKEQRVDYMILEVGIGGRADCTNTIEDPVVSVITQIGLDHTEVLGDTLLQVAAEKAGIIKTGAPVVTQSREPVVESLIRDVARRQKSAFSTVNDCEYEVTCQAREDHDGIHQVFNVRIDEDVYEDIELSMLGEHQVRNAITAMLAIRASGIAVTEKELRSGLRRAVNPGRFEVLETRPYFIVDGAHNENGIRASIDTFKKIFGTINNKNVFILFGCFKDKSYRGMINLLADEFSGCSFIATEPEGDRALDADTIRLILEDRGCEAISCHSAEEAYKVVSGSDYNIVYVLGSIYLISEIRTLKRKEN